MKNIAIVTGASSGLGRKLAIQISKICNIDEIWLIARRKNRLIELGNSIYKNFGVNAVVIPTDLADVNSVSRIYERLERVKPNIKILVNASGFGMVGESELLDRKSQADMIIVNCLSLFNMTNTCVKYMSSGSGIIQISSAASFCPQPYFAVYGATKSFVYSYSVALSKDLKSKNIHVLTVCPGPVDTEFFDVATRDENSIKDIFKKQFMQKEDEVVDKIIKAYLKRKTILNTNILMSCISLFSGVPQRVLAANIICKIYNR